MRIPEVTLDSKLTFKTHLREVVSKAERSRCCAQSRKVTWFSTCSQERFQCLSFVQLGVLCPCADVFCGVSFRFAG